MNKKLKNLVIIKLKMTKSPTQNPYFKNNRDINKIVVSNKVSFGEEGFKYFIGYKDGKKLRL